MLVISRGPGQSFLIGDSIEVTVVEVQDGRVKIGIKAPRDVRILRRELLDAVKSENAEAAGVELSLDSLARALRGKSSLGSPESSKPAK